ncbi:MAG TPA: hypothetical protein VFR35_15035 [Actinoplanes sp.]|nr:hypothetical protein [Actinoplanes sp.]
MNSEITDAAAAAWQILVRRRRRSRVSDPAVVARPVCGRSSPPGSAAAARCTSSRAARPVELRGLDRRHVSVDVAQFNRTAPVVQLEPAESWLIAAALDEGAKMVDRARSVEA